MNDTDDVKRGPGMRPMFLPDVERSEKPSPYTTLIRNMQQAGSEYPQIWHMFAFLPGRHRAPGAIHAGDSCAARLRSVRACAS